MTLHKLNGTSCGTGDIKAVLKDIGTLAAAGGILLYLEDVYKRQGDDFALFLLPCVQECTASLLGQQNGTVFLLFKVLCICLLYTSRCV